MKPESGSPDGSLGLRHPRLEPTPASARCALAYRSFGRVRGEQLLVHLRLQMADQPTRTLASGAEMPVLGLSVWQVAAGTEWALEAGYIG